MISTVSMLIAVTFTGLGWHLPSPHDKDGWGLRVHRFSVRGPYLKGEFIDRVRFDVTLINFSKETRTHDPLTVARRAGDLRLRISKLDGGDLRPLVPFQHRTRVPFTQHKLRNGEFCSQDFLFIQFGYFVFGGPGHYRVEATLKIDGKTITSPPVALEVVDILDDAVLVNHRIPLEGPAALQRPEEQEWPVIQQVKVGNRTLLIFRRYAARKDGGTAGYVARLVELPDKVEMKVEGASGGGRSLRVTYKDANSPTGSTTLVVNSFHGAPWTEKDEQALREREKEEARIAPPPRAVRP